MVARVTSWHAHSRDRLHGKQDHLDSIETYARSFTSGWTFSLARAFLTNILKCNPHTKLSFIGNVQSSYISLHISAQVWWHICKNLCHWEWEPLQPCLTEGNSASNVTAASDAHGVIFLWPRTLPLRTHERENWHPSGRSSLKQNHRVGRESESQSSRG